MVKLIYSDGSGHECWHTFAVEKKGTCVDCGCSWKVGWAMYLKSIGPTGGGFKHVNAIQT